MLFHKNTILALSLSTTMGLFAATRASAALFHFDINTAALIPATSSQLFSLDFTVVDGGTFTNTFTISNFSYTGGSATGSTGTVLGLGTATGNFTSSVTITSGGGTGVVNDIYQNFTAPTSDIQFDVTTTTVAGGTPDTFSVAILDNTAAPIYTSATDTSTLAELEIHTSTPQDPIIVSTYQSTDPSPTGVTASVVPEPGAGVALVSGVGILLGVRRRRVLG